MLFIYCIYVNCQLGYGYGEISSSPSRAHCKRLFDARLTHITDKTVRLAIRDNLHSLQTRNSPHIFTKGLQLHLAKWLKFKDEQVNDFINYFKEFYVDKPGWYEGHSIGDPSQSNGIESSHKQRKEHDRGIE